MSPDLRVPLSALPGFDPVGLRVRWGLDLLAWSGLVLGVDRGDGLVDTWGESGGIGQLPTDTAVLDLSDASTRDWIARWVAGRVGQTVGCTAPEWRHMWHHTWETRCPRAFDLDGEERRNDWSFGDEPPLGRKRWTEVLTLADLDPADPTLLPDGSRQVDAIALGRVAVHLGGGR